MTDHSTTVQWNMQPTTSQSWATIARDRGLLSFDEKLCRKRAAEWRDGANDIDAAFAVLCVALIDGEHRRLAGDTG